MSNKSLVTEMWCGFCGEIVNIEDTIIKTTKKGLKKRLCVVCKRQVRKVECIDARILSFRKKQKENKPVDSESKDKDKSEKNDKLVVNNQMVDK